MDEETEFQGYEEPEDLEPEDELDHGEGHLESEVVPMEEIEQSSGERQPNARRVTRNTLTKYERARLIGARAVQLAHGAPMAEIDRKGAVDPLELARIELLEKKIPFIIRRYLPDGSFEDWKLSELDDAKTDFDARR
uniref:Uncharacterized protein n=2 Tax=Palpitomonas bilix TaxID=652834 RepID=A0A7S3GGB2_9EUKA|mmetsp:Transcript_48021/g.124734  ORF Transcript_48021/g.124734 Transcript_48021/m.124734 type:complete len:137 (+) Transcript_48021:73-483(+)